MPLPSSLCHHHCATVIIIVPPPSCHCYHHCAVVTMTLLSLPCHCCCHLCATTARPSPSSLHYCGCHQATTVIITLILGELPSTSPEWKNVPQHPQCPLSIQTGCAPLWQQLQHRGESVPGTGGRAGRSFAVKSTINPKHPCWRFIRDLLCQGSDFPTTGKGSCAGGAAGGMSPCRCPIHRE